MWRRSWPVLRRRQRCFFSAASRGEPKDEGDWSYSQEWWRSSPHGDADGHAVFRRRSDHGNGIVSVVAYPSSRPSLEHWPAVEKWLQERHVRIHPELEPCGQFKILGYQWRVLHFNDNTRQSTVKVMAAYRTSDPNSLYMMQQPHCLAVPYTKSMVSAGLGTLASCGYNLSAAVSGMQNLNVLCIGHGGGSLPLFLASKIKGATVHIVEIDPLVISASVQAMGFPSFAAPEFTSPTLSKADDTFLWQDKLHRRLFLHQSDADDFIRNNFSTYDLVFIDAYDGDDIFPHKLWDSQGPFLEALRSRLNPVHGTVVVNLHADLESGSDVLEPILPMGKHVKQVSRAYKNHVGLAFTLPVPWLCNTTLVACNGGIWGKDDIAKAIFSGAMLVNSALDMPFPCLEYIKRGLVIVD